MSATDRLQHTMRSSNAPCAERGGKDRQTLAPDVDLRQVGAAAHVQVSQRWGNHQQRLQLLAVVQMELSQGRGPRQLQHKVPQVSAVGRTQVLQGTLRTRLGNTCMERRVSKNLCKKMSQSGRRWSAVEHNAGEGKLVATNAMSLNKKRRCRTLVNLVYHQTNPCKSGMMRLCVYSHRGWKICMCRWQGHRCDSFNS